MLLAIDAGNTDTVFGIWNGSAWVAIWRQSTADVLSSQKLDLGPVEALHMSNSEAAGFAVAYASVVPSVNVVLERAALQLGGDLYSVHPGAKGVLPITYDPIESVGADRLANCMGALELFLPPAIVVDVGTATTFDVVDPKGSFIGGAILAGPQTMLEALALHTRKLPRVDFRAPLSAIGHSTEEGLLVGNVLGYASMIDGLIVKMTHALGATPRCVLTGGLGSHFVDLCTTKFDFRPTLTLDGIRIAYLLSLTI